jgi:hypothetical protein
MIPNIVFSIKDPKEGSPHKTIDGKVGGGRAYGRNQRERRARMPPPPATVPRQAAPYETAASSR